MVSASTSRQWQALPLLLKHIVHEQVTTTSTNTTTRGYYNGGLHRGLLTPHRPPRQKKVEGSITQSTVVLLLESGNSGSRSHGLSAAQRSVRTPTQQRPRADFALLPVLSALKQQLNVSSRVVSHDLKVNFSQYSRCSWSKNFPN